ncbi:MAG: nucleotidyltransferase substrate binding protein [Deltaproteobacteria bacterium]|nr:nucleotidyltransferase substrate binding protein [Deltaproteobacteria bacterium]
MRKAVRWRQRFQNFTHAYQLLSRTAGIPNPSEAERGGLIQFFETAFELAWKTLKDYLEAQGISTKSPREVLKQAFHMELIAEGHAWMEALEDRNLIAHTYDEATSRKVEQLIKEKYLPILTTLHGSLSAKQ